MGQCCYQCGIHLSSARHWRQMLGRLPRQRVLPGVAEPWTACLVIWASCTGWLHLAERQRPGAAKQACKYITKHCHSIGTIGVLCLFGAEHMGFEEIIYIMYAITPPLKRMSTGAGAKVESSLLAPAGCTSMHRHRVSTDLRRVCNTCLQHLLDPTCLTDRSRRSCYCHGCHYDK